MDQFLQIGFGEVVHGGHVDVLDQDLVLGEDLQGAVEGNLASQSSVHPSEDGGPAEHTSSRYVRPHHGSLDACDARVDNHSDQLVRMLGVVGAAAVSPVGDGLGDGVLVRVNLERIVVTLGFRGEISQ